MKPHFSYSPSPFSPHNRVAPGPTPWCSSLTGGLGELIDQRFDIPTLSWRRIYPLDSRRPSRFVTR
jgi:hypothetical protein